MWFTRSLTIRLSIPVHSNRSLDGLTVWRSDSPFFSHTWRCNKQALPRCIARLLLLTRWYSKECAVSAMLCCDLAEWVAMGHSSPVQLQTKASIWYALSGSVPRTVPSVQESPGFRCFFPIDYLFLVIVIHHRRNSSCMEWIPSSLISSIYQVVLRISVFQPGWPEGNLIYPSPGKKADWYQIGNAIALTLPRLLFVSRDRLPVSTGSFSFLFFSFSCFLVFLFSFFFVLCAAGPF